MIKQLVYGGIFAVIFTVIIGGILFLLFRSAPTCFDDIQNQNEIGVDCGGVCGVICEQKNVKPVEILSLSGFPDGEGKIVLIAEIKNPNDNFGAENFVYSFNIYDFSGAKIKSVSSRSFLYAGETKFIFGLTEIPAADFPRKELVFSDYNWKTKDEFPMPDIQIKEYKTLFGGENSPYSVFIEGIAKNSDVFSVSKVSAIAAVFGKSGEIIGVSRTEWENFFPNEEKKFRIVFPKNLNFESIDSALTKIFIEVKR